MIKPRRITSRGFKLLLEKTFDLYLISIYSISQYQSEIFLFLGRLAKEGKLYINKYFNLLFTFWFPTWLSLGSNKKNSWIEVSVTFYWKIIFYLECQKRTILEINYKIKILLVVLNIYSGFYHSSANFYNDSRFANFMSFFTEFWSY